ncbi:MAG: hypothetical protein J5806_09435 [Lentisphaeria bacterium]|nr:hypothetical protein [Lentisphaeria bacterium]
MLMLKKGEATWCHLPEGGNGQPSTSYWRHPDYYWHRWIGISIDYAKDPKEG